jgi:YVTN family beta-propeller protein
MRFRFTFVLGLAALVTIAITERPRAADGPYSKIAEIPIGGAGSFDYLTVDSLAKRLYVTHGTEVVVIDTSNNTIVGRIADTPGVHGIAIAPGGRGFTSNGRENKVSIIDLKTLQTISKVDTEANPDAILYEPKQKEIYALNHTGKSVSVIGAATGKVVATIPLAGVAEEGAADPGLGRVFVNLEDKNSIDVIDIATHKVVANWPVAPAESPTGMAIDTATHRLFVGGGPSMVMIDATSGKVVANAPICKGTDGTAFDPGTKMAFSSCRDGNITAVHVDSPDKLTVVQTIVTTRGARTIALDRATHKLYTAAQKFPPVDPAAAAAVPPPAAGAAPAGRGPAGIPESFHVLVFGMK